MLDYPDLGEVINEEVNFKNKIYDMEININSILGFLKGWEIKYSKDGKEKNEFAKRNQTKIFSVIGNKNRGKSFILSKIANRPLPYGYSVTTKGLSVSFPTFDNVALLDSVGFESPLLETDAEDYRLQSDDPAYKNIYQKLDNIKKEIKDLRNKPKPDVNKVRDKENEYFRERNKFRKSIKNKDQQLYTLTNERKITDFFLQRFIIENTNIMLLVVEKLSIDDQFFLNKLTKLIRENNNKFLQKIIVIHNLMKMKEISVVNEYIENTLKKSLTFTLKEKQDIKLQGERAKRPYNKCRYFEETEDSSEKEITHLIMAQEGTEAGDFYNDSAIDYIRKAGKIVVDAKEVDIIEKLKQYFCKVSETILKFENEKESIKPEDIKLVNDGQLLKLDYKKGIKLETFYGDIINDTFGDPKFTPLYHIVSSDKKYVKIYLDCPGKTEIKEVLVSFPNQITKVTIRGKREKENIKTMGRKFGFGEFELKITLNRKDGEINKKNIIEPAENGFILIKFEREEKK